MVATVANGILEVIR